MARQRVGRPQRCSGPRRRAQPRPGRPPAQPQVDARDRGGRDQVRGVRLLRAGLPVAERHDHAAPADRAAPGDGALRWRRAGTGGARGRVRLRRHGDLRRRRLVHGRVPGRDRHRKAGEGTADRFALAPSRAGGRVAREAVRAGGARSARRGARRRRAATRRRTAPSPRSRARCGGRWGRRSSPCGRRRCLRPRPPSCPSPCARGRPPSTCRHASTASSATRTAGGRTRRCPRRSSPCQRAQAYLCGSPTTSRACAAASPGARRATFAATS